MDDWQNWNVVERIESVNAPVFLVGESKTAEEYLQREGALITEQWNEFRALLIDENSGSSGRKRKGYSAVCRLRKNLDSRLEKVKQRRENAYRQVAISKLTHYALKQRAQEHTAERIPEEGDSNPSDEELAATWEEVLEMQLAETWPREELEFPLDEEPSPLQEQEFPLDKRGLKVYLRTASEYSNSPQRDTPQFSEVSIGYIPEDEELKRWDIDPDSVSLSDILLFRGNTKWGRVFDKLKRFYEITSNSMERYGRTDDVLRFRRDILENVLHQFEAYGSVEKMTKENARSIAQESRKGRPRRLEDPQRVLETLNTVCAWLDTDPRPVFMGNDVGLVRFAADKFPHLSDSGTRDRISETFAQLAREYPDLPAPDLGTGVDGKKYLEEEDTI